MLTLVLVLILAIGRCEEQFCSVNGIESCEKNDVDNQRSSTYTKGIVCNLHNLQVKW
jgi:hypothetical protein